MILGCDEAGKGPVLGSMFVACVFGNSDDIPEEVDDSKKFSTSEVHDLSEKIEETVEFSVVEITTDRIDNNLMTDVTVEAYADAIKNIRYKKADSGYIDSFINDRDKLEERLRNAVDLKDTDLHCEYKADEKYPIVSAASIVAKSAREEHIDNLSDRYGDFGSGYPSDPNTREFLASYIAEHGEPPSCARNSWSTIDDMMTKDLGEY